MPEGDTIFRAARSLSLMLAGRKVLHAGSTAPGVNAASVVGRVIVSVEARGKNLLIRFDDDQILHTHMRMNGSWHIFPPTTRFRRPSAAARFVLEVDGAVAVCFRAPVVTLLRHGDLPRGVTTLGPDVLSESFDVDEALRRLREHRGHELGDAVLLQHVVAGIGNIYKSETLFACGVDPFARVEAFDDDTLRRVLEAARRFMRANVSTVRRHFHIAGEADRIWVYRRAGEPCFRCATTIAMRRQGEAGRSTYYCATCQRTALAAGPSPRPGDGG